MTDGSGESGRKKSRRTLLTQAGRHPSAHQGFINTPVFRGSTVLFPTVEDFERHRQPYTYATKGTPTTRALEEAWSEISGAKTTVLVPSGLGAIALALMTATKAGDHLLVSDLAYGPTRIFCDGVLKRFGVETQYYDPRLGAGVAALMRENTSRDPHGIARLAHHGGAGRAGDRASRGRARRLRHSRQHLGHAPLLSALRARRRHQCRSRHEISFRTRRPADRLGLRQCEMGGAPAQYLRRFCDGLERRRRLSRAPRLAHDGAAYARAGARRARDRAMARTAA